MKAAFVFLTTLCLLFSQIIVAEEESLQRRTLMLLDDITLQQSKYSNFLSLLKDQGHTVDVREANDKTITFKKYGIYEYENVIILAPTVKTVGAFNYKELHEFIEHGGNVILSSSTRLSSTQRQFAAECGVEFHHKDSVVMDQFNYVKDDPTNVLRNRIKSRGFSSVPSIVFDKTSAPEKYAVEFQGLGQTTADDNVLAFQVLSGNPSSYSKLPNVDTGGSFGIGSNLNLVTAVQGRNNARMLFVGSLSLFDVESNALFTNEITKWVFGLKGVLRASNVFHSRADGTSPDKMLKDIERPDQPISLYPDAEIARETLVYRIKDNLTYSFDLHEVTGRTTTSLIPFAADDVQLEFVMLDAYVRSTMSNDGNGRFSVTFTAPDAYGIFKFRVMYRRLGYSTIHLENQVSLRPYKHDEYERFIVTAYPYYASSFSMMAGVFLFSFLFLYTKN